MKRVVIIGVSCSGKSTLGAKLSAKWNIPHYDLDDYFWNPGWTQTPSLEFQEKVKELCNEEEWIMVGNYKEVADIIWARATEVIWLNYSLPLVLWRVTKRSIGRAISREQVCNGNIETFRAQFFSRDSLILWILKTFGRYRREYPKRISKYNLKTRVFRKPKELKCLV